MEKDYTRYEGCASAVAVILALVMLAVVLCGCRTKYITQTEYKEVPVVLHEKHTNASTTSAIITATAEEHPSYLVYSLSSIFDFFVSLHCILTLKESPEKEPFALALKKVGAFLFASNLLFALTRLNLN